MAALNQDLKLTLHSSYTIQPSEPTQKRSMFLSNIDQLLNFHVKAVVFFSANPDRSLDSVISMLRSAMEKLLVPYDFLAGRLKFNEEGRLEINCNAAGVSLAVGSCELELDELGELYPNPAFRQLTPMPELTGELEDRSLCAFQATSFKCGGYAFGISLNHCAMDAFGFSIFFLNLAALVSTKSLIIAPQTDHELLAARSPPRVPYAHPERVKLDEISKLPAILEADSDCLEFKLFHLGAQDISCLKEKASNDKLDARAVTGFSVVAAHLWRCKALATYGPDENKTSTLLYAVDIRRRLQPPLPPSYAGNAILSAHAKASCRDLDAGPFSRIVELVGEGATRMTDEYIRSVIDWGQLHKGFPMGDVFVTSWWKLGFGEMEFEWGKPKYFCPLPNPKREIIMLYQGDGGGVNILVGLPRKNMEMFQDLFYKKLLPLEPRL